MKQRIQQIIADKNTNLVFSADLPKTSEILRLTDQLKDKLLGVKLHCDTIEDINDDFLNKLSDMARSHNFIIIEDRKFCDIGNTVYNQSEKITEFADLITVHGISGPGVIDGLRTHCVKNNCGILLLAQMSSAGNLIDQRYTDAVLEMAKSNSDIVVGFISQEKLCKNNGKGFLYFTPGVRVDDKTDAMSQCYNTPQRLVDDKGVDVLIVGRGIYKAKYPIEIANNYIYTRKMSLLKQLWECGIVKHGTYTLKSGEISNVYADFRLLMGNPRLQKRVAENLLKLIDTTGDYTIVGVPLGGIPVATVVSGLSNRPMIMVRDKPKVYGRKNIIEGFSETKACIVIEDVISTGGSVKETIMKLKETGYYVKEVICILDRGGAKNVESAGHPCKALFKWDDFKIDRIN